YLDKKKEFTSFSRQNLLLQIGEAMLEEEAQRVAEEKRKYLKQQCPTLSIPDSMQSLQELCRKLHKQIDLVDEERYDMELKVKKSNKEIDDLKSKVQDLSGKYFKKPVLKRVRMSADAMLAALLGSKHKVSMDLRANLKQVKKEQKEEVGEKQTGDWRKNIEDKAGMDGRKKMFETETVLHYRTNNFS
uniref:Troponin I2, fast skeletal type n=1 Tax=Takifugu rubripes TaxID=31033 RepID=H2UNA3_TAKRU